MAEKRRWFEVFWAGRARRPPPATAGSIIHASSRGLPQALPSDPLPPPELNQERGVTGTEMFGGVISHEEYNPELAGQAGIKAFDKMRRSDAQVRATLQVMKLPLLSATWAIVPPEGGDSVDEAIADMCNAALVDDDAMVDPWNYALRHALLCLDFGFSPMEKVWRVDDEGFYSLKRLAPRLPKTIYAWHTRRDGTLVRIWQYAPVILDKPDDPAAIQAGRIPPPPSVSFQYLPIPGEALVVFTLDREGDNYEGLSMLRSSYRNWYYKDLIYHLDGVRLDRYGVGVPVAELSEGHGLTDDEIDGLGELLADLRSNERVWLIAPPGVRYRIMAPEGGGGAAASAASLIDHHDTMISRNVLAGFLTMGASALGQQTFGTRLTDLFISSLYGVASSIAGDLKRSVIKQLCDLNFDMTKRQYPTLIVRDLETQDVENMTGVLLKAVGTLITPDDDLENMLRKALKLPPLPEEMSRKAAAENASATGQPSQAPSSIPDPAAGGALPGGPAYQVVNTGDKLMPFAVVDQDGMTVSAYPDIEQAQAAQAAMDAKNG